MSLAAAALVFSSAPMATAKNYLVWGVGTKTCGAWTEAKLTNKGRSETFQSWAHGFTTGAAYGREGLDLRQGVKFEAEAVTAWIDAYCLSNPLMTVERAAVAALDHIAEGAPK